MTSNDVQLNKKVNPNLLKQRVTGTLEKICGATLTGFRYRCLDGDASKQSHLKVSNLYIGGEVHLTFEGEPCVVTWDENAGWEEHFSIYAGPSGLFKTDADMKWWDAATLLPWSSALDTRCESVRVLGQFNTPHIIEFKFEKSTISLADGSEERFGGGDDVLIRGENDMPSLTDWTVMWAHRNAT